MQPTQEDIQFPESAKSKMWEPGARKYFVFCLETGWTTKSIIKIWELRIEIVSRLIHLSYFFHLQYWIFVNMLCLAFYHIRQRQVS